MIFKVKYTKAQNDFNVEQWLSFRIKIIAFSAIYLMQKIPSTMMMLSLAFT